MVHLLVYQFVNVSKTTFIEKGMDHHCRLSIEKTEFEVGNILNFIIEMDFFCSKIRFLLVA